MSVLPPTDDVGLVVVDIQERLVPAMSNERLERNAATLVELARTLGWPILYSEQYPKGLGSTTPSLLSALEAAGAQRLEKLAFSVARDESFDTRVEATLPKNLIVIGIEAHVCMLQTVADLQSRGFQCFVPADAVASRAPENCRNGLELMAASGAVVVNTESVLFAALETAAHPEFRRLSKLIR